MLVTNMSSMSERVTRTATRLQASALRLFADRGFDGVTVEEIARDAGVSHMTFFRHFPTKEAVLLDDPYDPFIADAVSAQSAALPPLERVRRGLLTAWESAPSTTDDETRARARIMAAHPALRARAWQNTQRTEELIVEALIAQGTSRQQSVVAAGACIGAVMSALLEWGATDADEALGRRIVDALEMLGPRE